MQPGDGERTQSNQQGTVNGLQPPPEPQSNQPEPQANQQPAEIFRPPDPEQPQERSWIFQQLRQIVREHMQRLHPWIVQQIQRQQQEQQLQQRIQQLHQQRQQQEQQLQQHIQQLNQQLQQQEQDQRFQASSRPQLRRQPRIATTRPRSERRRPRLPRPEQKHNPRHDSVNNPLPNQPPEHRTLQEEILHRMGFQNPNPNPNPNPNADFNRGEVIDENANPNLLNPNCRSSQIDSCRDDIDGIRIFGQWLRPSVSQRRGDSVSGSNSNINPGENTEDETMNAMAVGPSSSRPPNYIPTTTSQPNASDEKHDEKHSNSDEEN